MVIVSYIAYMIGIHHSLPAFTSLFDLYSLKNLTNFTDIFTVYILCLCVSVSLSVSLYNMCMGHVA